MFHSVLLAAALAASASNPRALPPNPCLETNNKTPQEIVAACSKALKENDRSAPFYGSRGLAYIALWQGQLDGWLETGNEPDVNFLDQAISDLSQALKRTLPSKRKAVWFYARGQAYLDKRNFPEAIEDFDEAVKRDQSLRSAVLPIRGAAYFQLEKFDESLKDCEGLIKLEPGNPEGYSCRAQVRIEKGDKDGAAEDYALREQLAAQPK